jgi:putative CocE/NonD family hydrolase
LDGDGQRRQLQNGQPASQASRSTFTADPQNPVTDPYDAFGPHDYRELQTREDLLTFDSEPLQEELWVAGAITAVIHASCDCRDFDLWVRLQDVYPDGRAYNLMSPGNDVLRASYRDPEAGKQLLEPGRVYELRLPALNTSIRFGRGHRIRAQISASFAPHLSLNLQTGESEAVAAASKIADITIHHDAEHASRLLLPVVDVASSRDLPAGSLRTTRNAALRWDQAATP